MIDTHSHVNFIAFKDDDGEVIKRATEKNIAMINVGSQYSTSVRAVELAQKHMKVFAAVGLHPIQLQDVNVEEEGVKFQTRKEEFSYEAYRELASQDSVVAIGETGLDYVHVYDESRRHFIIDEQKQVFGRHIDLANELNLPVIVHCRGTKENMDVAYYDILSELKKNPPKAKGVMHCYAGPVELVKDFTELGMYISFNGILTFDKTGKIEQILLSTPKDRILTETDCPYLTPVPYRGKRNEPVYVEFVVEKIATILDMPKDKVIEQTVSNARQLFKLPI